MLTTDRKMILHAQELCACCDKHVINSFKLKWFLSFFFLSSLPTSLSSSRDLLNLKFWEVDTLFFVFF